MPYVLTRNRPEIADRPAALSPYLDLPGQSAGSIIDWVLELRNRSGMPHTQNEIGVDLDVIAEAAPMAEHDPSNGGNPTPLTVTDNEGLYAAAISGDTIAK